MANEVYTASFTGITISAAQDIFALLAPADAILEILEAHVMQYGTADFGDSQAEGLRVQWVYGEGATVGSGGAAVTPARHGSPSAGAASGVTARRNDTTIMTAGSGSLTIIKGEAFNLQVGYFHQPVPEARIIVSASDRLTLELLGNPADGFTGVGYITWMEKGG